MDSEQSVLAGAGHLRNCKQANYWGVIMQSTRWVVIRRFLVASACAIAPIASWANDIAQFRVARGSVYLERSGQRLPARVGTHLQATDTVVTGADGSAGIAFVDNSLLSIGPNSVLAVERYAFNSTTHEGAFDPLSARGLCRWCPGK